MGLLLVFESRLPDYLPDRSGRGYAAHCIGFLFQPDVIFGANPKRPKPFS